MQFVLTTLKRVVRLAALGAVAALFAIPALASAAKAPAEVKKALLVGDSLAKLTTPYLIGQVLDLKMLTYNEEDADSTQVVGFLKQVYTPDESVVAFDAGTIDEPPNPQTLTKHLREAAQIVGGKCMVVPTFEGLTKDSPGNAAMTQAVFDFASSRPKTLVPEWAGVVEMQPQMWLIPRGLHPSAEGAKYRAKMFAAAIHECVQINAGHREPRPQPVWLTPADQVQRALTAAGGSGSG